MVARNGITRWRIGEKTWQMGAWNQNRLTATLGIDYPIIQGPLAIWRNVWTSLESSWAHL
jgi:hypothetical protein